MKKLTFEMSGFDKKTWAKLVKLDTPQKIQNFLNKLKYNHEDDGETCAPPVRSLGSGKIHCFEGALIAALALWIHGERPLLLDLRAAHEDLDHVVTLFKRGGKWGALSKTNHGVLRYREPVYRDVRELAMSYFHEYFLNNGRKTLRSFSKPFDLSKLGTSWITAKEDLYDLSHELDNSPHTNILTKAQIKKLRLADPVEIKMGRITEYR